MKNYLICLLLLLVMSIRLIAQNVGSATLVVGPKSSLLAGCTPATMGTSPCPTPSGWTLAATQDFEGTIPAGQDISPTSGGIVSGVAHTGNNALKATISGDAAAIYWATHVAATEYYISFWEHDDPNATTGQDFFFARVWRPNSTFGSDEVIIDSGDGSLGPGYISPSNVVVFVEQGTLDFADWNKSNSITVGQSGWHQYEFWLRGSSCSGSTPNKDGFYNFYVDGQLRLSNSNLATTPCPTFNGDSNVNVQAGGVNSYNMVTSGTTTSSPCLSPDAGLTQVSCNPFGICPKFRADNPSLTCWGSQGTFNRYIDDVIVLKR